MYATTNETKHNEKLCNTATTYVINKHTRSMVNQLSVLLKFNLIIWKALQMSTIESQLVDVEDMIREFEWELMLNFFLIIFLKINHIISKATGCARQNNML